MKKEYQKPYINTIEIKVSENITDGSSLILDDGQDGTTKKYGIISYNSLNY